MRVELPSSVAGDLLIVPSISFPINPTEASNTDLNLDLSFIPTCSCAARTLWFRRPCHCADDLRVAHLQVGGAIRAGLRADLGCQASELIPAPSIKPEKCQVICGGIERHVEWLWYSVQWRWGAMKYFVLDSAIRLDLDRGLEFG